jgi:ferritin
VAGGRRVHGSDEETGSFMKADVLRAINVQINSEFSAWYQYLAMAAFCEREQFTGAARWLQAQSVEEYQHGMKLFNFVLARGGVVELTTIEEPVREFESFGEVFERALRQEMQVTAQINDLYELCFTAKSFAEMTELQWFLTEQVEEERVAREWVAKFRLVGDDPGSLLDLDRELGTRTTP